MFRGVGWCHWRRSGATVVSRRKRIAGGIIRNGLPGGGGMKRLCNSFATKWVSKGSTERFTASSPISRSVEAHPRYADQYQEIANINIKKSQILIRPDDDEFRHIFSLVLDGVLCRSRNSALTSLKVGNKRRAPRCAAEMKVASQGRERCTSLLERVENVLQVITDAGSSKKVTLLRRCESERRPANLTMMAILDGFQKSYSVDFGPLNMLRAAAFEGAHYF